MSVWLVLGIVLVALTASVLFGFFYWRPRARRQVTGATEALARELHGRPPLLIAPAQCRRADVRDGSSLRGLGVLALTDEAVLYSSGERVVVLQRDGVRASTRGRRLELTSTVPAGSMVLAVADPGPWRSAFGS
jgi:hypothetical protein